MSVSFEFHRKKHVPNLKVLHSEPNSTEMISSQLMHVFSSIPFKQDVVIVCIGTDRSTGDSLGPLVGSNLKKINTPRLHVYGTLPDPVHALNLNDTLTSIMNQHKNPFIVAIDACLGQLSSVGNIQVGDGPVKPGAGVNKDLPPVGDIHITGIVNVGGFMEYFVLQNTRLSLVVSLAEIIANSIYISFMNTRQTHATPYLQLDV
jgi:putative sporulation protein YyaC